MPSPSMADPGMATSSHLQHDLPSPLSSSTSSSSTERNPSRLETQVPDYADVEKSAGAAEEQDGVGPRARRVTSTRISRVQSLSNRRAYDNTFSHPLAHAKTAPDVIVDFEGPDDPYHPLNWPLRKKVVTTTLYGLCTMVRRLPPLMPTMP